MIRAVLDTNVLIAALRSRQGASFRLLSLLGDPRWQPALSVALLLEYEAIASRHAQALHLPQWVVDAILNQICLHAHFQSIRFRVRPALPDPDDDFVLELAVASQSRYLVTHNLRDFSLAAQFGIAAIAPREFLAILEKEPT